jgi:TRAP-type C4-dicarboxylate transport system permease small subunit
MAALSRWIGLWYARLIEGLAALAGFMIAGICLLIVWDVIARNLGLQPPASTVALTEYALLYFTMAASPWLVRTRGHIVVEVLHSRLGTGSRAVVDKIILAICLVVSITVSVLAALLMLEALQRGEVEIRSLNMPRAFLFLPLTIGFGLMASEFLRLAILGEAVADPSQQKEHL